jgi:hypothetical protein
MDIGLKERRVRVRAPRALCFDVVGAAGTTRRVLSETEKIVEFRTDYRGREIVTLERLVLDRPARIDYRWIEGPLPEVTETISFEELGPRTTDMIYRGRFAPRRGPLQWLLGRLVVKPAFDRLVLEHLNQGKEVAERRAARSKLHPVAGDPPPPSPPPGDVR